MMKKASEYRKMTDNAINARIAEKEHDAQNYVDVVLVQLVEQAAREGKDAIEDDIPHVVDKMIV